MKGAEAQPSLQRPTKLPIWLSAFAYPGAGQFAQRRWVRGTLYAAAFTTASVWLLWHVLGALAHNVLVALDLADRRGDPLAPFAVIVWGKVLALLASAVGVHLTSVLDAVAVYRQACRAWSAERAWEALRPSLVVRAHQEKNAE